MFHHHRHRRVGIGQRRHIAPVYGSCRRRRPACALPVNLRTGVDLTPAASYFAGALRRVAKDVSADREMA